MIDGHGSQGNKNDHSPTPCPETTTGHLSGSGFTCHHLHHGGCPQAGLQCLHSPHVCLEGPDGRQQQKIVWNLSQELPRRGPTHRVAEICKHFPTDGQTDDSDSSPDMQAGRRTDRQTDGQRETWQLLMVIDCVMQCFALSLFEQTEELSCIISHV